MKTATALSTLLAASALSTGAAIGANGDTTATIGMPKYLTAGATAPFDAAGVPGIRRGRPIPEDWLLVGRAVTVESGTGAAGAAVRLACPGSKTLRTLGGTGNAGLHIDRPYLRRQATNVMSFGRRGGSASGTLYGVCR
ncbi:MAG: hypothetical protein JWO90_562 [Solirubrobacterales bacterium]|jgi:hypothetical protein|nr:hypothetical protein [Solirubrobacterales bacterium]